MNTSPIRTPQRYLISALLLGLSAMPLARGAASADPLEITVLARTGAGGFTALGSGASINDNGYVAFMGRYDNSDGLPRENIYSYNLAGKHMQPLLNDFFVLPATPEATNQPAHGFLPTVQVNNQNQVVATRELWAVIQQWTFLFPLGWLPGTLMKARLSYAESYPVTGNATTSGKVGLPDRMLVMGDNDVAKHGISFCTLPWQYMMAGAWPGWLPYDPYCYSSIPFTYYYFLGPVTGAIYPSKFDQTGWFSFIRNVSMNNLGQYVFFGYASGVTQCIGTEPTAKSYIYFPIDYIANPMIADDGFFVWRHGVANSADILVNRSDWGAWGTIASRDMGFTEFGQPGISDDGRFVAFCGDLASDTNGQSQAFGLGTGPGVFISMGGSGVGPRTLVRLASVAKPSQDGLDTMDGIVSSFSYEHRACVNNDGRVVFIGTNLDNKRALFRLRIDTSAAPPFVGEVDQLLAVGDRVDGLSGAIADIAIHDALDNDRLIVCWVATDGGGQAILAIRDNECGSCRTCLPGDVNCGVDSLSVTVGLGSSSTDGRPGVLRIRAKVPDESLSQPAGLTLLASSGFGRVLKDGVLRQVKAPAALVDIRPVDDYGYAIEFYTETGPLDFITGLYAPIGSPFATVQIENPDRSVSNNRLRITRNGSEVNLFTYDPPSGTWELASGIGSALRKESLQQVVDGTRRVETRSIRDLAGTLVNQTVNEYETFPWGEELVRTTDGLAQSTRTVEYRYYTNRADGLRYSRLQSVVPSDGGWEYYLEYGQLGPQKVVRQFLNNPYTETTVWPDPDNRCTEVVLSQTNTVEMTTEYLRGQPTSRRWRVENVTPGETWDCVATQPGATNWSDPSNLITKSWRYLATDAAGAASGRTAKSLNPDGTCSIYRYFTDSIPDPFYTGADNPPSITIRRSVSWSGQPDTNLTAVVAGVRSEAVEDLAGNLLWRQDFDIHTDLLLASERTVERDRFGRATRILYLDGTFVTRTYDCCGLAQETDREGITTTYSTGGTVLLDLAHTGTPQTYTGSSVTRAGITTYTLTDAMGRATHTVLQGANGALIVQEQRGYDSEGNLAWTLDAMDWLTTYTNTTDGPFRVATTTFPDGSQSIEATYQDGSAYETKGNAVQGMRYSYDVVRDNGVWVQTTTQTRLESDGSLSPEYTTTYTDFAGRAYKTEYPWPDGGTNVFALREYNTQGQLVKSSDPDGLTTLYGYNGRGELETTALDLANPGSIDLDGTDRITRTTSSVENSALRGTVVRKSVTEVWETNGVNQSTLLQTSETSADGTQTWTSQYGLTTHTITDIDRANQRRTVTTVNPDSTSSVTVFEQGRQKSVTRFDSTGARVSQTLFAYDSFGRLQGQTDARNGTTTYTYYDDGQLHTVTTPDPEPSASGPGKDAQTTSYTYFRDPANGLKTLTTLPDGGVVTQEYFPGGQLKRTWGARTYPAEYTYDRAGRMATLTTWQQFDFATGMGIAGSATTRWNYNARGLLANKRYADNKGPSYTYTAGGKLKTRLWARGVLTTYGYDPQAGDLLTTTYSDATPAVTNSYDRLGRLASVTDASGLRTLGYRHGQTATEAYGPGLFVGLTLVRDYDDLDRQAALSVNSPTGTIYHVTYGYDAASRLNTVTSGANVALYTYHPDSALVHTLTQSHSNSVRLTTTKLYDKLGRLESITSVPSADSPISFAYDYNDANQRTRVVLANGEYWTYGYDALGQVTNGVKRFPNGAPIPGYSFGYQFDQIGNRLSASRDGRSDGYTNNALNQIVSIDYSPWLHVLGRVSNNASITVNGQMPLRSDGYFYAQLAATSVWNSVSVQARAADQATNGTDALAEETGHLFQPTNAVPFQYDDDGNLLSDGRWSMTWDAENRVIQKESLATAPTEAHSQVKYVYDALSRRVSCRRHYRRPHGWDEVSQSFYFANQMEVLLQFPAIHHEARQSFVWAIDLSGTRHGAGGIGGLLLIESHVPSQREVQIPTVDAHGNVQGLIPLESRGLTARYEYDPFGVTLQLSGQSAAPNPWRFSSKITEPVSLDVHYELRDYRPSLGVWLRRDPLGEKAGLALYAPCDNDVVNGYDLFGLYPGLQGHGTPIPPGESARLIRHLQQEADQRYLPELLRRIELGIFVVPLHWDSDPTYQRLSYMLGAIGTNEKNRFVFTCRDGWIDHGHFLRNAVYAYALHNRWLPYIGGLTVEMGQALVMSDSTFSVEDLMSNRRGGEFGLALARSASPRWETLFNPHLQGQDVAAKWRMFMRDAGAVKWDTWGAQSQRVRRLIRSDMERFQMLPPLDRQAHSPEAARRYKRNQPLWKCLCNEANGDMPAKDLQFR